MNLEPTELHIVFLTLSREFLAIIDDSYGGELQDYARTLLTLLSKLMYSHPSIALDDSCKYRYRHCVRKFDEFTSRVNAG